MTDRFPARPRRPMLAVAYGPPTMARALDELPRLAELGAECVELRLDLFAEAVDLAALLRARGGLPVVVTLRPTDQGGRSTLDASARLRILREAASLGAEYVDVEFDALTSQGLDSLHADGARVIISRHDFRTMPRLSAWWADLARSGADVVKVVGTARAASDTLEVIRASRCADRPTIAIGMGAAGLASRVLVLREPDCLLTYAALDEQTGTAPGQISLGDMRAVYRADTIGPTTRVYGLLGPHVETERLAQYASWFAEDGVDAIAVPFPVAEDADVAQIVRDFDELPVWGWHIHGLALQQRVMAALGDVAPAAGSESRVNAIVRGPDGRLSGDWVTSPREQYALWRDAINGKG